MRSWQKRISDIYQCADCSGAVRKVGAVPIVKGSMMKYKCIRCGSTGVQKDKLSYSSPKTYGEIEPS